MSGFKVTPDQLTGLSCAVARVSGQVRAEHQGLKGQLSPLFGADWSGAAAGRFTALFEEFDRSARALSDALDAIGQLLGRAGATYRDAEATIAASFR